MSAEELSHELNRASIVVRAYLANDASWAGDCSVPLAAGGSSKRLAAKPPHGSK